MEKSYWESRWTKNKIGFHAPEADDSLIRYWNQFSGPEGSPVFVPLCGKSLDMRWLAECGHHVKGVEFVEKACREFFDELNIIPNETSSHGFRIFSSGPYEIWCGDLFRLPGSFFRGISAAYDRASLVALPPVERKKYADFFNQLADLKNILLVTFDYDQTIMSGPPFSVPLEEIRQLYGSNFEITVLEDTDIIQDLQKFQNKGLREMRKLTFRLDSKKSAGLNSENV